MCRLFRLAVVLAVTAAVAPPVDAAPPQSAADLVRADRSTLESLYANGTVGEIPMGFLPGKAIPKPGARAAAFRSRAVGVVWQGKVFHGDGTGHNRVFGFADAVPVEVSVGPSWYDGAPSILVDYANTSRLFKSVRDEIREVSPGVYVGLAYSRTSSGPKLVMHFALDAPPAAAGCCTAPRR